MAEWFQPETDADRARINRLTDLFTDGGIHRESSLRERLAELERDMDAVKIRLGMDGAAERREALGIVIANRLPER